VNITTRVQDKMANKKAIEWQCEYRECVIVFKRYMCYVERGTKRYCCQSHSALEDAAKKKETGTGRYDKNKESFFCNYCKNSNKIAKSGYCQNCRNIRARTRPFGLNIKDYFDMLETQNGRCLICHVNKCATGKNFAIDHDHKTGKVRGLLCASCNSKLGWYENKKQAIELYLNG